MVLQNTLHIETVSCKRCYASKKSVSTQSASESAKFFVETCNIFWYVTILFNDLLLFSYILWNIHTLLSFDLTMTYENVETLSSYFLKPSFNYLLMHLSKMLSISLWPNFSKNYWKKKEKRKKNGLGRSLNLRKQCVHLTGALALAWN